MQESVAIFTAWKENIGSSNSIISDLQGAFKYRCRLVHGRFGSPTYADGLADAIWRIIGGSLFIETEPNLIEKDGVLVFSCRSIGDVEKALDDLRQDRHRSLGRME